MWCFKVLIGCILNVKMINKIDFEMTALRIKSTHNIVDNKRHRFDLCLLCYVQNKRRRGYAVSGTCS